MTKSTKTTKNAKATKRSPKGMKATQRILAAIDATGAQRAPGMEKKPSAIGGGDAMREALKVLRGGKGSSTSSMDNLQPCLPPA